LSRSDHLREWPPNSALNPRVRVALDGEPSGLQVFRSQSRALRDPSKHPGTDLFIAGTFFTMVESVGDYPKREGLNLRDRFVARGPVRHRTGQLNDLGDPAAIGLLLDIDANRHQVSDPRGVPENMRSKRDSE